MELAVTQLGGHPVTVRHDEVGIDTREPAEDIARTLACFHAVIGARVFEHAKLERMAAVSPVPVVNMLSDLTHPLQALADLLTIRQVFGDLAGRTVAYVGDGNNVCRSLMVAGAMSGMKVRVAAPPGFEPSPDDLARAAAHGLDVAVTGRPEEAVDGADVVYTDVWASMGEESDAVRRRQLFEGFTVDTALLDRAAPGGIFLHCLPAHRGEEVSAGVVDGPRSHVWRLAENRMHAARGLLAFLLAS
jgi:ornithine carbamoyltransferase